MPLRTLSIALLCLFASTAGQAAEQPTAPSRSEMRKACFSDYRRFCSDFQPGSGEVRQCFIDHKSELSPACADVLKRQAAANG